MAVSEVEAVLEYLKSNGFFHTESALIQDLGDQGDRLLASFDFVKFLFPMLPLPPPVRIPPRPSSTADDGDGNGERSSGSSSDDQFMSLGSSTSEVASSSDFVNPYGLQSSSTPDSDTSSGRMSQFGTARTYNDFDFDMQNDLYLYDEKSDEGHFLTPCYRVPDPLLGPAEDKFIMSSEINVSKESAEEEEHEAGESVDLDDGYWEQTDFNGLEMKNFENMDVSENNASLGKDLLTIDSNNFVTRDSGEDWLDKPKLDFSPTEEHMGKDAMSNEDLGDGVEFTEEPDQGGESHDDALMLEGLEDEDYEVFELRIVHRKNKTGFEENKEFPIVLNTIIAGRYYVTEYLGSAAFSKVIQAHDLHTGMDVCLKIIKNDKDFFDQSLDEIKLLKLVNKHDPGDERHILRLYDYFYHQEHLFIVCELLRANLYEFQKFNQESGGEAYFTLDRLQVITRQCLEALDYLHGLGIIHCDLKPENILIKSYRRSEIKIIDLGSSCFGSDSLCLYVQSRSYRAPEVILGLPYDHKIDMWSLGCILAELCSGEVLFPNDAVVMILSRMIGMLGPIDLKMLLRGQETSKYFTEEYDLYFVNEETDQVEFIIPEESSLERHLGVSDMGFIDFVKCLLEMNPKRRPTAKEALEHPWLSHKYTGSS